ncbi:LCP family protein [Pseudarthrobacter cellobiosi]|uniref:LCP family protein n=1 Tax=Pseudarthrobacter cellobiosi TaxID=2953654 RepID=UPI00208E797B|nr:LCP family protein [Pseudarthrobacter sp. HLT1-5]MCO4254738.1 LCP family protein [Pseudarthrobacter sp. HLT1-5]
MTLPVETEQRDDETGVKRKKHTGRTVIIVMAIIVLIAAVLSGSYIANLAGSFNSKTEKIESAFPEESTRPQKSEVTSGPPAKNILLMGSDSRGAAPDSQTAAPSDQRSDVLMLVHIPSDRKNVYSISLMRDLWVSIPGHGEAKINAALALGGVPLVVQTVESILSQRIDHVASLDFEGFKGLTEALGGVEVNSNVAFSTGPFSYVAGTNTLSGDKALAFVRERYAFPDGDYQRVRNQQAFIKGVLAKTINADTLSNPVTVSNLVNVFSPFVAVDKSLDAAALGSLAVELKDVRPQNMTMFTLPTGGIGTSVDGQSIVFSDKTAVQEVSKALTEDKLSDYIAAKNLQNGN